MQTIRIEFTYLYEDFYPRRRFSWRSHFTPLNIAGWLTVIGCGVAAIFAFRQPPVPGQAAGSGGSSLRHFLPYLAVFAVAFLFSRFKRAGKAAWEKAHPQQPIVITLDESKVLIEWPTYRSELLWPTFNRYEENDLGVTLWSPDAMSLFLPGRAIPDEVREDLLKLLSERISQTQGFPVMPPK